MIEEARAAGLGDDEVRGSAYRRVFHRVYAPADLPDTLETRAAAALLVLPAGSALSHHTAAELRGLPVPPDPRVRAVVPAGRRVRLRGIRTREGAPATEQRDGRPLTTPTENFIELATELTLVDLVILGDAMVRRGFVTCVSLRRACASSSRDGAIAARRAAKLVRPRVDSPRETRVRLMIVFAGLPEPTTNLVIRDDEGGWLAEVDLGWGRWRVVVEYHGDVHRERPGKWRSDIAKQEVLVDHGWRVIILTADDLRWHPARALERIRRALARRGADVPEELDERWREVLP